MMDTEDGQFFIKVWLLNCDPQTRDAKLITFLVELGPLCADP